MPTIADFRERFPEFVDDADTAINFSIADAALMMNSKEKWLEFYDVAHLYYAAHLHYLANQAAMGDGGATGPISKQAVDDVVIERAVSAISASASDLYSTYYGKRYMHYRKLVIGFIIGV